MPSSCVEQVFIFPNLSLSTIMSWLGCRAWDVVDASGCPSVDVIEKSGEWTLSGSCRKDFVFRSSHWS